MSVVGRRRRSREECFRVLYRVAVTEETSTEALDALKADEKLDPEVVDYAVHLLSLVDLYRDEIDTTIRGSLDRWDLERVAQTDRAVLRMAVAELNYCPDVPAKVAIDEAIEIAKRYGSNESGGFVNGVLDKVARERGGL